MVIVDLSVDDQKTSEPEQSYHKINVLDELCELRKQFEELKNDIIQIKKILNLPE